MQGYAPGFPVLLSTRMSQHRSADALQYLLDGNYLDKQSKRLTAELLTYNGDLQVVGYTRITFDWQQDGSIKGDCCANSRKLCGRVGCVLNAQWLAENAPAG